MSLSPPVASVTWAVTVFEETVMSSTYPLARSATYTWDESEVAAMAMGCGVVPGRVTVVATPVDVAIAETEFEL